MDSGWQELPSLAGLVGVGRSQTREDATYSSKWLYCCGGESGPDEGAAPVGTILAETGGPGDGIAAEYPSGGYPSGWASHSALPILRARL
jgi:hypothetical protein